MSLKKWSIFCIDENTWTEGWLEGDGEPTVCFNNNLHLVNENSKKELQSTSLLNVKIQQEDIPTGGFYSVDGYSMTIPPNSLGVKIITWPFPVTVTVVNIKTTQEQLGDILNTYIAPMTPIGVILTNIEPGVNTVMTNSTVFSILEVGFEVFIAGEFLGRVINIDRTNLMVTFETACQNFYPLGTVFYAQSHPIRNFDLGYPNGNELGVSNIGGKYIRAGLPTKIEYQNNSEVEKKFCFTVEYLF